MEEHGSVLSARLTIGLQQGTQALPLMRRAGVRVAESSRRADGGTGAATHTQMRIDLNLLALDLAGDGRCRTDFHAGVATH
ncbi:hypothetical protein RZS08_19920, partial [Arthrospira platensis SPKY1]|nr:hypothetical protein [Arthrospira platensis SPKY1]